MRLNRAQLEAKHAIAMLVETRISLCGPARTKEWSDV